MEVARLIDGQPLRDGATSAPPTFIDAFAGCGGLSLGLARAGWQGLMAIEKDPFAHATLAANFGPGQRFDHRWPVGIERRGWDLRELLTAHEDALRGLAGRVDLLAGGPPCQGFSHAGRRRADDPRNRLFEDYLDLVALLRPSLVLVENVRGFEVTFTKGGVPAGAANFARALRERLNAEYEVTSAIVRAGDHGVPQARPRYFLVGARRGAARVRAVPGFFAALLDRKDAFLARRDLPRYPSARDAISDLEVERNGVVPCPDTKGFDAIAYQGPRSDFQRAMRDGHQGPPADTRLARHRPEIAARFAAIIRACREEGRLATTISAEVRRRHGLTKMAIRVLDPLGPAPTITSLPDDLLHYAEPRTLTVRENARLQTFPDWFSFKGKYTTGGERRRREVPRFTQVANAVPPLLAEQIGECLKDLLIGRDAEMVKNAIAYGVDLPSVLPQFDSELI